MLDVLLWDEDAYVVDVTLCEKPALVGHKCNGAEFHDVNLCYPARMRYYFCQPVNNAIDDIADAMAAACAAVRSVTIELLALPARESFIQNPTS
jgi:hypothetical protein